MLEDSNKADVTLRIHYAIQALSEDEARGTDMMKATLLLAGMYVETAFLFDNCEEALQGSFTKLGSMLQCDPLMGDMAQDAMPPPNIIDFDTEMGRAMAREFFECFGDRFCHDHDEL